MRDCEYFHQSIANIKYNEKNLKLCRIFYLINFYNYYLSLSIDLRVDFFKRMKCITNNWNITFEDLKISREDSDKIINIYEFYSGLPFETKFVRLFSVIPLISVKKYSKKIWFNLFSLIPILKIRKKKNKTYFNLFGIIPILKIKNL